MAACGVTIRVVNSDTVQDNVVRLDAKGLHGSVLDIESSDGRVVQAMGVEELGLRLAAVGALPIPPASAATVDGVVGCSGNDDV